MQNPITCRVCKQVKDISDYYPSPRRKCGYEPCCKSCRDFQKYERRRERRIEKGLLVKFPTLAGRKLMEEGSRYCPKCKNVKLINEFQKVNNRNKYNSYCKECASHTKKEYNNKPEVREKRIIKYYQDNRSSYIRYSLKSKYKMSVDDYNNLLSLQLGVCAICFKTPEENKTRLCVDHNHKTKHIRGLLCFKCNQLLGMCNEDTSILQKTINYITVYNKL